ncbi:MAG: SpoIIE family protein phosphatase [Bacteroidales bacterium]
MERTALVEFLSQDLEPALVEEMVQYKLLEFPAGVNVGEYYNDIDGHLPFVVEGVVHLSTIDRFGKELVIYPMHTKESCIITLTETLRNVWGLNSVIPSNKPMNMYTDSKAKILAIPIEATVKWAEKYLSWQKFVMRLYQERLAELLAQHDLIVEQKNEIVVQNDQITSSIQYAQRIQQAVLTSGWYIDERLPEHFVFYKPRNIVSGDFYWMSHINSPENDENNLSEGDLILIAAADCTGHGVPGAFMSMLGISFLNEIIAHYQYHSTDGILNILREKVKKSLQHSVDPNTPKDGMDIALCIIDLQNYKMQFSGANNPLYLYRNQQLIEVKGTKNPIGQYIREVPFQMDEIDILKHDVFYIFSDGYLSQFGGENDETFKSKRFKEMLSEIHQKPMFEQERILDSRFKAWKGNNEQTDDVLVIGIRI